MILIELILLAINCVWHKFTAGIYLVQLQKQLKNQQQPDQEQKQVTSYHLCHKRWALINGPLHLHLTPQIEIDAIGTDLVA